MSMRYPYDPDDDLTEDNEESADESTDESAYEEYPNNYTYPNQNLISDNTEDDINNNGDDIEYQTEDDDAEGEDIEEEDNDNSEGQIEEQVESIEARVKSVKNISNTGGKVAKTAGKTAKSGAKIAKTASSVGSFIVKLFIPPMLYGTLIVLAVVLVIALILIIIPAINSAPYSNIDTSIGVFDTANGITGEDFYGARIVYRDDEQAIKDLDYYYENLSCNYLSNVGEMTGVTLTLSLNYTDERPEELTALVKIIANCTDNSDEDLPLADSLKLIDHFGYTDYEIDEMRTNLINYLTVNKDDYFSFAEDYASDIGTDLAYVFDVNYLSLNTTSELYYVKDIILLTDDDMIRGLSKANYVALIYMPKKSVEFKQVEYMFYLQDKEEDPTSPTKIKCEIIKVENNSESILSSSEVDSSWWSNNTATNTAKAENIDFSLSQFESIDEDLTKLNGQSLYSLIYNSNTITLQKEKVDKYFSFVQHTSSGTENYDYSELVYLPRLDNDYLYLRFSADGEFQFCEYDLNYKNAN